MEDSFEFLTRFWCNVSYIHPNTNYTKCEEFFYTSNIQKRMEMRGCNIYEGTHTIIVGKVDHYNQGHNQTNKRLNDKGV